MNIIDPEMKHKFDRALAQGQNLYDLDDIGNALTTGHMQSHVIGNTMAITRVHDWPQKRSVEILYVVGDLTESLAMDKYLEEWARSIGANLVTAVGRDGWWEHRTPGWKKIGTLYAKDI